jgi:hypothetical protein
VAKAKVKTASAKAPAHVPAAPAKPRPTANGARHLNGGFHLKMGDGKDSLDADFQRQ